MMTPSGQPFDVLFVGTNQGKILKIVNTADAEGGGGRQELPNKPVFVEEIVAFPKSVTIRKLEVVKTKVKGLASPVPRLLIMTRSVNFF